MNSFIRQLLTPKPTATALIPLLHAIQARFNYLPAFALAALADALQCSVAEIHSVSSFYHLFNHSPRAYDIRFSHNIIEIYQGKAALMQQLLDGLQLKQGQVRPDLRVCVDNTSCIGMSDQGISALVNGLPVTHLTPARITQMIELIEQSIPISQWPATFFQIDHRIQHKNRLLNSQIKAGDVLTKLSDKAQMWQTLQQAGIRGCGGAGFPVYQKWRLCQATPAKQRIIVCNADEGEPATFKDRVLLSDYPEWVIEGMTIAAQLIEANQGFIYLRGEYRYLLPMLEAVLAQRRRLGLLGPAAGFDIQIYLGAGAYVCGAETALLNSLEGQRGIPRAVPPYPVNHGYLGWPTVVNNVETLAQVTLAFLIGGQHFAQIGTAASKGTKLFSVSGDCQAGIYELPFGTTVAELLALANATEVQAVQNAGAAGQLLLSPDFHRRFCFDDVASTGSFMVFNRQRDLSAMVANFAQFFAAESCGFCTPCRVGTRLMAKTVEKIQAGQGHARDVDDLTDLCHLLRHHSHCGLGSSAGNHIRDTLTQRPDLYPLKA
jgi:[NiFe] hydrogenase diaphorase moiety large subunit